MGPDGLRPHDIEPMEVDDLTARAERQIETLLRLHAEVSARVLARG